MRLPNRCSQAVIAAAVSLMTSGARAGSATAPEDRHTVIPASGDYSVRPSLSASQLALLVFDHTKDNNTLVTYRPNSNYFARIDIGYRGFGVNAGVELPGTKKDEQTHGTTTASDFQLYYYGRSIGVDLFRQRYSGFYSELGAGTGLGVLDGQGIREDLRMTNAGANAYYVFSDEFSLQAAFRQTAHQLKTGYSFVLGASTSRYSVDARRTLIPESHREALDEWEGYRGGVYGNFSVLPGFAITWVPSGSDHFYMTFFALMGLGLTHAQIETDAGRETQVTDNYKVNAKYGIGYNGHRLYAGATAVLDLAATATMSKSTLNVGSGVIFLEAFAGARF